MARTIDTDKALARIATRNEQLAADVAKLRGAGVSQDLIATALGTTRQAVAKRFPVMAAASAQTNRIAGRRATGTTGPTTRGRGRPATGRGR